MKPAPVPVVIGGETYQLVFNMLAVEKYMEATGQSLFLRAELDQIGPVVNPGKFSSALWAGLQTKHPDLTRDFIHTELRHWETPAALDAMYSALNGHFPEPRPKPANPPEPEAAPAEIPAESQNVVAATA